MPFDLEVFNSETYTAMTETVAQDINKFNEASQGTITLINRPSRGDEDIKSSFKLSKFWWVITKTKTVFCAAIRQPEVEQPQATQHQKAYQPLMQNAKRQRNDAYLSKLKQQITNNKEFLCLSILKFLIVKPTPR